MNKDTNLIFEAYATKPDVYNDKFFAECAEIGKEFYSGKGLLEEGIWDRTKARVAGAVKGDSNQPGQKEQAQIANLANSFKIKAQKNIKEIKDFLANTNDPILKDPLVQQKVEEIDLLTQNFEPTLLSKAGKGALGLYSKASSAVANKVEAGLKKIIDKAKSTPIGQNATQKYEELVAKAKQKFPKLTQQFDDFSELIKKYPKSINIGIVLLTATLTYSGIGPGALLTGLLLRSAKGVIVGEPIEKAVSKAIGSAAVGGSLGMAAREIVDMLDGIDATDLDVDAEQPASEITKGPYTPEEIEELRKDLEAEKKAVFDKATELKVKAPGAGYEQIKFNNGRLLNADQYSRDYLVARRDLQLIDMKKMLLDGITDENRDTYKLLANTSKMLTRTIGDQYGDTVDLDVFRQFNDYNNQANLDAAEARAVRSGEVAGTNPGGQAMDADETQARADKYSDPELSASAAKNYGFDHLENPSGQLAAVDKLNELESIAKEKYGLNHNITDFKDADMMSGFDIYSPKSLANLKDQIVARFDLDRHSLEDGKFHLSDEERNNLQALMKDVDYKLGMIRDGVRYSRGSDLSAQDWSEY